jgi:hypothetical protein
MRKLKLEDLAVETFETANADGNGRGTVHGLQTEVPTCATCAPPLCFGSKRWTGCCTNDPFQGCTDGFNC